MDTLKRELSLLWSKEKISRKHKLAADCYYILNGATTIIGYGSTGSYS